jgi:alpha/beta superfamily hydrolase
MKNAATLLNEIATLLNTTDKNLVISVAIKSLTEQGLTVKQAFEVIFGEGSYEKMAGEIYDALKAA